MATFLLARDDGDYGALTFEENYNPQTVYEEMVAEGIDKKELPNPEYDGEIIEVKVKRFGEVDPAFEAFIFDTLIDYDHTKMVNIYRVKETIE